MGDDVRAVTTCAGDPAWQVTGYERIRRLLAEPRLGRTHPEPDQAPRYSDSVIFGRPQPASPTEAADHDRMRELLGPSFSPRHMRMLRPRVQQLVDGVLDELDREGPPVDLRSAVSFPLPALVICELLGVPYDDREAFRRWSDDAADMTDEARSFSGLGALWQYMLGLVEAKRSRPGDDVLSELVKGWDSNSDPPNTEEVAMLGAALLFAGHETTVAAIDKGLVLALTDGRVRHALSNEPAVVETAVEEILRLPLPVPTPDPGAAGLPRWANTDLELEGTTIRAGELVLLDLQGANLDEDAFGSPESFDVKRTHPSHLAFGHGSHYCLGAPLARLELQVLLGSLFKRFPSLRLAVPVEDLRPRSHLLTGGLHALPVEW